MKLLLLKSSRRNVSEHSSAATSATTASGSAFASVHAFAKPDVPPQPNPKTVMRFTFGFSLILFIISASMLGVASPVVERTDLRIVERPQYFINIGESGFE